MLSGRKSQLIENESSSMNIKFGCAVPADVASGIVGNSTLPALDVEDSIGSVLIRAAHNSMRARKARREYLEVWGCVYMLISNDQ